MDYGDILGAGIDGTSDSNTGGVESTQEDVEAFFGGF